MAAFPQCSRAIQLLVEIIGVPATDDFHGVGNRIFAARRDKKMDMARHQAVGMDCGTVSSGDLFPEFKVKKRSSPDRENRPCGYSLAGQYDRETPGCTSVDVVA
jgi:hypothetical protein